MRTGWIIVAVGAVVVLGMLSGVAGLFLGPLIGGLAIIAIVVWLLMRWSRREPPAV